MHKDQGRSKRPDLSNNAKDIVYIGKCNTCQYKTRSAHRSPCSECADRGSKWIPNERSKNAVKVLMDQADVLLEENLMLQARLKALERKLEQMGLTIIEINRQMMTNRYYTKHQYYDHATASYKAVTESSTNKFMHYFDEELSIAAEKDKS